MANLLNDNVISDYWSRIESGVKDGFWSIRARKSKQWSNYFDQEMDLSLLHGSFQELKDQMERKRLQQEKYQLCNPFLPTLEIFDTGQKTIKDSMKCEWMKDIGFVSKRGRNKMGIALNVGANGLSERQDRFRVQFWNALADGKQQEMSMRLRYFAPSLQPDKNINNIQFSGRMQNISPRDSEYKYSIKYCSLDTEINKLFAAQAKMFITEHAGGQDTQNLVLGIYMKSINNIIKRTDTSSEYFGFKQGMYADMTNRSVYLKTNYQIDQTRLYKPKIEQFLDWYLIHQNKSSLAFLTPIGNAIIPSDRFTPQFVPGYLNSRLYDDPLSRLFIRLRNIQKLELFESTPSKINFYVQMHSAFESTTFDFTRFISIKDIIAKHSRAVLTVGTSVELGAFRVQFNFNCFDVIPFLLRRRQPNGFQDINILIGCLDCE